MVSVGGLSQNLKYYLFHIALILGFYSNSFWDNKTNSSYHELMAYLGMYN